MYLFPIIGLLTPLVYVIIWNLTHQKQIKSALRNKQVNDSYANKLSANYSPRQKKWNLLIATYLISVVFLSILLVINGHYRYIQLILPIAIFGWLGLTKLGNHIAK